MNHLTNAPTAERPAILGGNPAVTLDQEAANRWPVLTTDDERTVIQIPAGDRKSVV